MSQDLALVERTVGAPVAPFLPQLEIIGTQIVGPVFDALFGEASGIPANRILREIHAAAAAAALAPPPPPPPPPPPAPVLRPAFLQLRTTRGIAIE